MKKNANGNRWLVLLGAVLLQVCLGAIYTWSLFNQPLMDAFGWTQSEVYLTYSIAIFVFAFATIFSGRLNDKIGPRKVASIGAVLYGGGLILASTATSLGVLYLSYGVLAGAGVGFGYVCPLSTLVKWFPEKKGTITGVAVGAFGAGSLVFKSIIQSLLNSVGVSQTLFYLGIIFFVVAFIGAQLLKVPTTQKNVQNTSDDSKDFTLSEMIKTRAFYKIWVAYLLACMPGLLVIGLAKDIGVDLVNLSSETAAGTVSLIALFNAGGRLVLGGISDKIGRKTTILFMFLISATSLTFMSVGSLSYLTFFLCLAGIAFGYGGFLAVFPTITGEYFGIKNLGGNYGVVYQAYGIAALIGPIIKNASSGFPQTFMIAAFCTIIGAIITSTFKSPESK